MKTFEASTSGSTWTEVLQGGTRVYFDVIGAVPVEVYLNDFGDPDPTSDTKGNLVQTFPEGWDFQMVGAEAGEQQVWVRGENGVIGVRQ